MGLNRKFKHLWDVKEAAQTKAHNRVVKAKERLRRDERMVDELKKGSLPYSPVVMSWLSRKLDRPSGKITQKEVQTLLK